MSYRKLLCVFLDRHESCDDAHLRGLTLEAARILDVRGLNLQDGDPWLNAVCAFAKCQPEDEAFIDNLVKEMMRWHGTAAISRIALAFIMNSLK